MTFMKHTTTDRFLRYVSYPTQSDEMSETCPSTEKQRVFGAALAEELQKIGLTDVELDAHGYLYATLPAEGTADGTTVALIAHMDTSPDAPDAPVRARIVQYDGTPIELSAGIFLSNAEYPALDLYRGQELVVTDGKTLLGADDKAGVAEIVTACEKIIREKIPHRRIRICFTPDEEIGRGADLCDLAKLGADYGYTVDGGRLGGIEYENFNAATAVVTVHGRSIHPGDAKDKMINASRLAMEFDAQLPQDEIPEKTEGYEGFHHLVGMKGACEEAELVYIIRDHDAAKFREKKDGFSALAARLDRKYGAGTFELSLQDSYYNMASVIADHMELIEDAKRAMRSVGIEPKTEPIRGGTDGARLSFMGLPCPNLCTGGENYHSRFEYVPVGSMEKITDMLIVLVSPADR